jgi:ubiquinone/menaquinone biosynthesis C-methylase UbiE
MTTLVRSIDEQATARTRLRYGRIAAIYDRFETFAETSFKPMRKRLCGEIDQRLPIGARVLEVGVGTGKNIPYWPENKLMTAVDLTPEMLKQAIKKAQALDKQSKIEVDDVQALDSSSNSFEGAAASFVFCSVPDPVLGLEELKRVVRPGGTIVLLEHVRSETVVVGKIMDLLNPIIVRIVGANINRDTVQNVRRSGLDIERIEDLGMSGLVKLIIARAPDD